MIYVEEDGVAGWPRDALEHDQVPDACQVREPVEQPTGETGRGDDADVQHYARGVTEGSAAAGRVAVGGSADSAGLAGVSRAEAT